MAAAELKRLLENGNIVNSRSDFPDCNMGAIVGSRVCIAHKNIPNTKLTQISNVFANKGINIENIKFTKSKKDYAFYHA